MFKSKIFNSVMRYMLVAMLALLPNTIWGQEKGEEKRDAYIQEFKNPDGKGVLIKNIESLLLKHDMLEKASDGTSYDVSKKPLFLKISIYKKDDNTLQDATKFTVHRGIQWGGFNEINTTDLNAWPNVAYKATEGIIYYSGKTSNFSPQEIQFKFIQKESQDLTDYVIKIVASNDAPTIENGLVVSLPTNVLNITYTVKERPFKHYKGYANADGDFEVIDAAKGQLRQKTYTWEYTYSLDDTEENKSVALTLPLQDYATRGHDLEPLGYFRWYNYDTDMASNNLKADLTTGGSITRYQHELKDEKGNSKGIFAYNLPINTNAWQGNVGVIYTRPDDKKWVGETIACDVSRYVDGIDATGSYMEHESTLSIRYIFHIIPATQLAAQVKDYLINSENDLTYEDNKNVTVGFANNQSTMTLRLNMKPNMYYFYPMTNAQHHVYYPVGSTDRQIQKSDFGRELKKATKVIWRVYNGDKDRYCDFGSNVPDYPRFFDVSQDLLNNKSWKDLDGNASPDNITFKYGDHFSIVAYAVDDSGNSSCPIANFNCRFFSFHPMKDTEMGDAEITRKISYLEENFNRVALVSFDADSPEQTLSAPTNDMDNQSEHPSYWSRRNYGFVYKKLMDKSATHTGSVSWFDPMHSPLHGEYGIYKTANVKGISSSSNTDKYLWHCDSKLYDRTHEITGGSQTGSFLYIDASDESRTIASTEFSANLCTGQQMAFSAYVADMTGAQTKPQLMFKLFGLDGGKKVLLHSFSSGDFKTNRDSDDKGKWYQVYGKITLQKEEHAELYDNFRIEIDNYSKGTQGADYAVDDIRIYLKPAKVEVLQEKPVCGGATTGTVKLKIRAIHETLNAILNHKDTKIYFRLVDEKGNPVTGDGLYDYTLKKPGETVAQKITTDKSYASVDVFNSEEKCKKPQIRNL